MTTQPSIELETYVYHSDGCTVNLDLARDPSVKHVSPPKTLVFFHGGGLVSGSRRARFPPLPVKLLLERGWVVVVPDYRLLPEASISHILDDLKSLETWLVRNSTKLGFDAGNVAISGSSAGSFVAILAISTWTEVHPRAFYGLWSMVNTASDWYSRVRDDDERIGPVLARSLQEANFSDLLKPNNPQVSDDRVEMTNPQSRSSFFLWLLRTGKIGSMINASLREAVGKDNPLDLIDSKFPPSVLLHGTADTVAPFSDSCELSKRIAMFGIPVRLFEANGADHGIAPQAQYQRLFDDSVDVLEEFFHH